MKCCVSLLLILSFVVITIFGFAIFNHVMHSQNSGCAASTVDWTVCPTSLANMALHHISALRAFLQTSLPSTALSLLLTLFFAAISLFLLRKKLLFPQFAFLFRRYKIYATHIISQQKIISWLALFELSPTL